MASTTAYQVIINSIAIKSMPSSISSTLGTLSKGAIVNVTSFTGNWAYFTYNNKKAYIPSSSIVLVPATGTIIIKYIDTDTKLEISTQAIYTNLQLKSYSFTSQEISGYTAFGNVSQTVTLIQTNLNQNITFQYRSLDKIYMVDLKTFNIYNDNTNANATTKGINSALVYAKSQCYKKIQLPPGTYSIDTSVKNPLVLSDGTNTWTHNRQGITMQSDMELILTNVILQILPCEDPYYSILTISNCINIKITGGTILGDRYTHDYGMRINENADMFESGGIDSTTGQIKADDTRVRTKNFITGYKDWFSGNIETLPSKFYIIPLWNTTMNTVDGGCRYIYCYDNDNNYLGLTTGGSGYISQALLPPGTSKIKISLKNEKRNDIVLAMTKRTLYYTYEFGSGITVAASNNITLDGVIVRECIGDCICTLAPPINVTVDNFNILNCTLENSRRQGISFVATGQNYLVERCNIGKINGTDPQSGIDIEHYNYVKNMIIDNCNFYDNKKLDIINYNGNDIEVKNSKFNGTIGSTFGWNMNIHDNNFNCKSIGVAALNLSTDKTDLIGAYFKVYNNTFKNYTSTGNTSALKNSSFSNNKLYNCNSFTISCNNSSNEFSNCNIWYNNNTNLTLVSNSIYQDSIINVSNDLPSIIFNNNCNFNNSLLNARGVTTVDTCTFNMTDKSIIDGWKTPITNVLYTNCIINSNYTTNIGLLGSNLNVKSTFEKCIFNISRYTLALSYGNLTFNSCQFKFNTLNISTYSVDLNRSGYGYVTSPWYFNNCYFESSFPVKINGGNVINPSIVGNITIL